MSSKNPTAGSVEECAEDLGISISAYRRDWIRPGRVKTFDFGGRGESVLWADHHAAVVKVATEQIANPELKKPRSNGARHAAQGRIANPWGCKGRPKDAPRPAKAVRK
jgi:hypothetical protein